MIKKHKVLKAESVSAFKLKYLKKHHKDGKLFFFLQFDNTKLKREKARKHLIKAVSRSAL